MLPKRDLVELVKHLKKDKVLRTQTFLMSKKLSAGSVVEKDGTTLLHLVCKMGAENVFWTIKRGARPEVYLAKDKHGRTACHYAAIHLIKTHKMSVFQNIIQPMIEDCSGCLHAPDRDGRTPLQVISAHPTCANMLRAQLGSTESVPPPGRQPDAWHEKIWAEMQYENARFDKYDPDFSECLSDEPEDADSFAERISAEHRRKHAPSPPAGPERHRSPRSDQSQENRSQESRSQDRSQERSQDRSQERRSQEQEEQRRFREAEERRRSEEEARRRAREEARRKMAQTPPCATAKLSKAVRRYRVLHKLVHDEEGPLVAADFRPLAGMTVRELKRMVETGAENASERRRAVRDMLRLWHPDKCMAKIERRMTGSVDPVKTQVVSFVQLLNQLL